MIGKLKGLVEAKNAPRMMVDVGGVCYEVDVPLSTFFSLPEIGQPVVLLTHFVVREDAQQLFGFLTSGELEMFRRLIKISGVGPKMALGILSGLSAEEFSQAVEREDAARLVKIPGVGKKTAERLILELRGKLVSALEKVAQAAVKAPSHADIEEALISLGYSEKEAASAVKLLPSDVGVSDGIKQAIKLLSR